jgi:Outer membrane receptor proteins, mostly Fe transport
VGAVEQSVEVSAQGLSLQTENGEVRSAITTASLENIPTPIGRNYQSLLITVPGVMPPANQHSVAANPSRGLTFNVNGTTRNSNNVRIDGALANNIWLPHVTAYVPGLDAIESVSIVTASADASEGMAGGSAINVQIKSGTNQIHGSLFEFHADSALKAKPFFLPVGQGIPKYIDNQFGGSAGGPIVKNRLFYFGSWEDSLNRQTGASFVTVPTAAMHMGDLSGSTTPLYDPLSGNADGTGRTPFSGNMIPANRIDTIAAKVMAAYPLPTFPSLLSNNYYATGAYAYSRSKLDAKGTWLATSKLNINGRIGWLKYTMSDPPVFGQNGGGPVASAGGRAGTAHGDVDSMTYSGSYVLRPNFIIDSYFGYTKSISDHDPVGLDQQIGLKTLGLAGTNVTPFAGGWPDFQVSSYSDVGTPGGSSTLRYRDSQLEYTANASWVKAAHTVRFGADISRYSLNHYEATSAMGVFAFNGGQTTLKGGPSANQYNSVAQLLLGLTSSVVSELLPFDNNQLTSRQKSYSLYGQDMWQVSRRLTSSLGLRWDYFPMGTRATRGMERYDFNTNQMLICGRGGIPTDCGYHIEQKNFSPRIGLAYRPTDTTVIRAGFGINYDPYPLAFVRDMLTNYPEDLLLTVNPTVATYGPATQLKDGIPSIQVPDLSSGRVTVPVAYATRSLPDHVVRGYIESWNFSLQKQMRGGWMAQAAYVGSRQLKINQRLDLNAGQVLGAGTAGQPYFAKFGRTTATELLTPIGHNKYDSLQTSLQRRMAQGVSMNFNYTFSKALGICCDDLADGYPSIQIPQSMNLNRAVMPYDRTHTFGAAFLAEPPFGQGKKWLSTGWQQSWRAGWPAERADCCILRSAFHGYFECSAERAEQQPARQPGKIFHRDFGWHGSEPVVLRSTGVYSGRHGGHWKLGAGRGSRSGHIQFRRRCVPRLPVYGALEDAVPGRSAELDQHSPFRQPGCERIEPGVEPGRLHQEPGRLHGDYQHHGYRARRDRRTAVSIRIADYFLRRCRPCDSSDSLSTGLANRLPSQPTPTGRRGVYRGPGCPPHNKSRCSVVGKLNDVGHIKAATIAVGSTNDRARVHLPKRGVSDRLTRDLRSNKA